MADRLARRHRGGRMITQALGLFCGAPWVFLVGWTLQVPLLILSMACFGLFKGIYDSNIWSSVHNVVPAGPKATAVGFINSTSWLGGGAATMIIAAASPRFGMGICLSTTSLIYVFFGMLMLGGVAKSMCK